MLSVQNKEWINENYTHTLIQIDTNVRIDRYINIRAQSHTHTHTHTHEGINAI